MLVGAPPPSYEMAETLKQPLGTAGACGVWVWGSPTEGAPINIVNVSFDQYQGDSSATLPRGPQATS